MRKLNSQGKEKKNLLPAKDNNIRRTLTAIGRISSGARIGKLHAVLVHAPTHAHRTVALRRLVEALAIAVGRIRAQQFVAETPSHRRTRPVGLLEAPAPLPRAHRAVLVHRAGVNERLNAALVLVVLQIEELLGGQDAVVIQVQVAKHPLGLGFTCRREVAWGGGKREKEKEKLRFKSLHIGVVCMEEWIKHSWSTLGGIFSV